VVDLWRLEHPAAEEQAEVHDAIRQGLADIEAGRYRPVVVVMEELRAKYDLPAK
jgi:predicted transcriptional regulator